MIPCMATPVIFVLFSIMLISRIIHNVVHYFQPGSNFKKLISFYMHMEGIIHWLTSCMANIYVHAGLQYF